MNENAKEKTKMPFGKKLAIGAAIALAVVALLLAGLWFVLADYQAARPEELAQQVRTAYIEADANTLAPLCTNLPATLQDAPALKEYLQETTAGKAVEVQEKAATADGTVYEYTVDGTPFAQLTVRPSGTKTTFGFAKYESAGLVQLAQATYTITAPAGATLLLNGETLPESYLTGQKAVVETSGGEALNSALYNVYTITDFVVVGSLEAALEDGTPCEVNVDATGTQYTVTGAPSQEDAQAVYDAALPIVEDYVDYTIRRNALDTNLLPRMIEGTPLYEMVSAYSTTDGESFTDSRYENVVTDGAVYYGQGLYSCNVSLQYIITGADGEEKSFDFSAKVTMQRQEDAWYMAALENN